MFTLLCVYYNMVIQPLTSSVFPFSSSPLFLFCSWALWAHSYSGLSISLTPGGTWRCS